MLADRLTVKAGETSDIIVDEMARVRVKRGDFSDLASAINHIRTSPKEQMRPEMIETGDRLCEANPAALAMGLIDRGYQVISGIRRVSEYKALLSLYPQIVLLWVDRQDQGVSDNTDYSLKEIAHHVIDNYGAASEIHVQVHLAMGAIADRRMPDTLNPIGNKGMKSWRTRDEVSAGRIEEVSQNAGRDTWCLTLAGIARSTIVDDVPDAVIKAYQPKPGWYYLRLDDDSERGIELCIPPHTFEANFVQSFKQSTQLGSAR
jgi:hypothetical protein